MYRRVVAYVVRDGSLLVFDHRDIPVVVASILVVAVAYGVGNLLADVTSILLNPRLRT